MIENPRCCFARHERKVPVPWSIWFTFFVLGYSELWTDKSQFMRWLSVKNISWFVLCVPGKTIMYEIDSILTGRVHVFLLRHFGSIMIQMVYQVDEVENPQFRITESFIESFSEVFECSLSVEATLQLGGPMDCCMCWPCWSQWTSFNCCVPSCLRHSANWTSPRTLSTLNGTKQCSTCLWVHFQ